MDPKRRMNYFRKNKSKNNVLVIILSILIVCASPMTGFAAVTDNHDSYRYETITDVLGITRADIIEWLSLHEHDDYYLGTPYCYRTGDVINGRVVPESYDIHGSKWGLWPYGYAVYPYIYSPNGDVIEGGVAQMNCGGFVHHVLTHALNKDGTEDPGTKEKLTALENAYDLSGMGFAGASAFFLAMQGAGVRFYCYDTIEQMLSSGILEKGDIIIIDGMGCYGMTPDRFNNPGDWHIGFFWGNDSDDDVFWHSIHNALGEKSITLWDGTVLTNPAIIDDPKYTDQVIIGPLNDTYNKTDPVMYGNIISRISPASEYYGTIVIKFGDMDPGWHGRSDGVRSNLTTIPFRKKISFLSAHIICAAVIYHVLSLCLNFTVMK